MTPGYYLAHATSLDWKLPALRTSSSEHACARTHAQSTFSLCLFPYLMLARALSFTHTISMYQQGQLHQHQPVVFEDFLEQHSGWETCCDTLRRSA